MAKAKETVSRTLIVALVLSIVFSVVVSTAAVMLKPAQVKNQSLDIKTNILSAAGMLPAGASAEQIEEATDVKISFAQGALYTLSRAAPRCSVVK